MKIFINPGDMSISANALKDSDVTANIGQGVAAHLKEANFTTKVQQLENVEEIYNESNNWQADVFVSIHCNSAGAAASGTETFYCQGSQKGQELAQKVQSRIVSTVGTVDRGIKEDTQSASGSLSVLRKTACPAILVELAFISNANDAQLLRDRQNDFAQAIAKGIMDYCGVEAGNVATATASTATAAVILNIDYEVVAKLARKYEDDEPATVTVSTGDTFYGIYQLSSNKKTVNDFVNWLCNYPDEAFANYGKSLAENEVNTEAFIAAWKNLTTVDPGNFLKLQDEFVKTNYFDKAVNALAQENFNLAKHSDAMKAVIFNRSLQDGTAECVNLMKNACKRLNQPNLSYVDDKYFDNNLINAAYDILAESNKPISANERADALGILN